MFYLVRAEDEDGMDSYVCGLYETEAEANALVTYMKRVCPHDVCWITPIRLGDLEL